MYKSFVTRILSVLQKKIQCSFCNIPHTLNKKRQFDLEESEETNFLQFEVNGGLSNI